MSLDISNFSDMSHDMLFYIHSKDKSNMICIWSYDDVAGNTYARHVDESLSIAINARLAMTAKIEDTKSRGIICIKFYDRPFIGYDFYIRKVTNTLHNFVTKYIDDDTRLEMVLGDFRKKFFIQDPDRIYVKILS